MSDAVALPPLPKGDAYFRTFSTKTMEEYARTAVLQERQRNSAMCAKVLSENVKERGPLFAQACDMCAAAIRSGK